MPEVVIAGIGESAFRRRSPLSFSELQVEAVETALADAGLQAADVDTVFTDGEIMPDLLGIDVLEGLAGLTGVQAFGTFSLGGSGISYATRVAAERIGAGLSDVVLVYFGVDWGTRPGGPYTFHDRYPMKNLFEVPYGFFGQPIFVAAMTHRYADDYDIDIPELKLSLGQVAVDQRANALRNTNAQMKVPLTMDEYLAAKPISSPFGKFDCCLITDGAAAFVITRADHPRRRRRPREAVIIGTGYGHSMYSEEDYLTQNPYYPRVDPAGIAAAGAFRAAGVSPTELDFLELYDCFTTFVLLQLEELGICRPGEGWKFVRDGIDTTSGRLAVNTHGGALSHSYVLGVTHMTEAARQLRHEAGEGQVADARLGAVSLAPGHDHTTILLASE